MCGPDCHLQAHGVRAFDFSANEMAKLHIRHMVGGHAPHADHELLYRFEFPERPGALLDFLTSMSHTWNISLFHYRNHGTDYGRVLIGIQVPPQDQAAFQEFLDRRGYVYCDESQNAAYQLFLLTAAYLGFSSPPKGYILDHPIEIYPERPGWTRSE